MTRKWKIINTLAIVLALLGFNAASALAYQPSDQQVCINSGAGKCIQHVSGGLTLTAQSNVGADDKVSAIAAGCNNGIVSAAAGCPWTGSSADLDTTYNGHQIICLNFVHAGGFYQGNGQNGQLTIASTCGATGTWFVVDGSGFVNVHDSQGVDLGMYISAFQPSNNTVEDIGFQGNNSRWGPCSSC